MIIIKAQADGIATRKDRTIKVTFSTQELKGKDAAKLLDLQNKLVTLGIAENEITPDEIQLLQDAKLSIEDVPNGKSQSQRLRSVLYIYFEQNDTGFDEFNAFYNDYTNKIINNVKSKLEA
jgi:hypothetical protein